MAEVTQWPLLPKKVVLYNPDEKLKGGGAPIEDFPVSELQVDENGNPVKDQRTGDPKRTGEVYQWTILPGERKKFPKYVARILADTYKFLRVEDVSEEDEEEVVNDKRGENQPEPTEADSAKADEIRCRFCEFKFGTIKALSTHVSDQHPNEILKG